MRTLERILSILIVALVAWLPFEFRLFPLMSNLQWLFAISVAVALPILLRDRNKLLRNRLVLGGIVFVLIQWLAALFAGQFGTNAIIGAARITAGFFLLCVTLSLQEDRPVLLRTWSIAAGVAAVYGILDYAGAGFPELFREEEFYAGAALRLSGSFEYPNTAAAFFGLSLPVVWLTPKAVWLRIVASLLVWIALILTYSRGATLAAMLVLLVWILTTRSRNALQLGGLCAGAYIATLALNPFLVGRLQEPIAEKTLAAEYEPAFNLLKTGPGEFGELSIRVTNTGARTWLPDGEDAVSMSYHWFDPARKRQVPGPVLHTRIPGPIRPQESLSMNASFRTPEEPGLYVLFWDLVQPKNGWFASHGVPPAMVEVHVREGSETSSGWGNPERLYPARASVQAVANASVPRSDLWSAAVSLFRENPVLGAGPDSFRLLYGEKLGVSSWDTNVRSNSLYLELLANSGVLGLLGFVLLLSPIRWSATAPVLGIGIFLSHGLTDVFLMTTPIYFAFWILLGLAGSDSDLTAHSTFNNIGNQP